MTTAHHHFDPLHQGPLKVKGHLILNTAHLVQLVQSA